MPTTHKSVSLQSKAIKKKQKKISQIRAEIDKNNLTPSSLQLSDDRILNIESTGSGKSVTPYE
jgi:hypothetical protein